jgi:hypothetical protein
MSAMRQRKPKSERNPKSEAPCRAAKIFQLGCRETNPAAASNFGFRASFGIRISAFGFIGRFPVACSNLHLKLFAGFQRAGE